MKFLFVSKPVASYHSSLGDLAIFLISAGHQEKLMSALSVPLSSYSPLKFAKALLPYICYPQESLDADQSKPSTIVLTSEMVDTLAENEIDDISKIHIDNERYLNCKHVSTSSKDKDGNSVTTVGYGEVKYPKEEAETNTQYLHRLYVLREKRQKEEIDHLLGSAAFSPQVSKYIEKTLSMGNSITAAIDAMRLHTGFGSLAQSLNSLRLDAGLGSVVEDLKRKTDMAARLERDTGLGNIMEDLKRKTDMAARLERDTGLGNIMEDLKRKTDMAARLERDTGLGRIAEGQNAGVESFENNVDSLQGKDEGIADGNINSFIEPPSKTDLERLSENVQSLSNDMTDRLDKLIAVSSDSGTFMVEVNKTQTAIASEIKASGTSAARFSKWNVRLTIIVVALTFIGIIFAWSDSRLTMVLDEMKQSRVSQDNKFDKILDEQSKTVEQLREQQFSDRETIGKLKARISELEEKTNQPMPQDDNN